MKPSILLRLILSLIIVVAFVLGATFAEANNSLNPTALWWAQRQLPLLWAVDGFALLALLPVFGSAALQTRLAYKNDELTHLRDQHETQMEDMIRHTEETERINMQQAKGIEDLEETVAVLNARLNAMEAEARTHQERMEVEMRRLALEAFATLAEEVQTNTRQMDAVSLAMQYQRAEIKQLRQNIRTVQRPHEVTEIARLTPYELAALHNDGPPRLLEEGEGKEEEKRRRGEEETEQENSSFHPGIQRASRDEAKTEGNAPPSSLSGSSIPNATPTSPGGFFEPTMNAQTTFVSPTTEYDIPALAFDAPEDTTFAMGAQNPIPVQEEIHSPPTELHLDKIPEGRDLRSVASEERPDPHAGTDVSSNINLLPLDLQADGSPPQGNAASNSVVTAEEYRFLHGAIEDTASHNVDSEARIEPNNLDPTLTQPQQVTAPQTETPLTDMPPTESQTENQPDESQQSDEPRGLRRWFLRL